MEFICVHEKLLGGVVQKGEGRTDHRRESFLSNVGVIQVASVGQVHRERLRVGRVVILVQSRELLQEQGAENHIFGLGLLVLVQILNVNGAEPGVFIISGKSTNREHGVAVITRELDLESPAIVPQIRVLRASFGQMTLSSYNIFTSQLRGDCLVYLVKQVGRLFP